MSHPINLLIFLVCIDLAHKWRHCHRIWWGWAVVTSFCTKFFYERFQQKCLRITFFGEFYSEVYLKKKSQDVLMGLSFSCSIRIKHIPRDFLDNIFYELVWKFVRFNKCTFVFLIKKKIFPPFKDRHDITISSVAHEVLFAFVIQFISREKRLRNTHKLSLSALSLISFTQS